VPWEPQLSTVAFRLSGHGDQGNQRFLERILAANRVLLSSTRIAGKHMIRLCVLGHRTHVDRIDEAIDIIRNAADDTADGRAEE
jgi:aromatic-L-amino-acid decarboxylase